MMKQYIRTNKGPYVCQHKYFRNALCDFSEQRWEVFLDTEGNGPWVGLTPKEDKR